MDGEQRDTPRRRVTARLRELRFDAGALSLNLVATVGRRPGVPVERMGDVARLETWCRGVGLVPAEGQDPQEMLRSLHALRAAAFDIASSALDGHRPRPASVDLVNQLARAQPPVPRLELAADGGGWVPKNGRALTREALLSLVARDLIDLMTDEARSSRLTACASEVCRMLFLDSGGGRPRKWCSMRRCGNQAKAAGHRSRAGGPR
ncbi:ABATE domain-containing protein [Strepomyces sp. STD 3.1]|uniref:CGNR zinc finger domain-containing protein n=1 Tax=Streptomyces sp. NPDC058985 TaxID=3346684 RepID=UPI001F253E5C|nr:ABATE domain-containing protein [Streptomyces sp. STD 3.1]